MNSLRFLCLTFILCSPAFGDDSQSIPVSELGSKYKLVGKLHSALGSYIQVEGVVVEGPLKGYGGGPNIRAQRIQGRATQEDIQIAISPYFAKWGEKYGGLSLPKLVMGHTYEMEGYEEGAYYGTPKEAAENERIITQSGPFHFLTNFVVVKAKEIEAIRFAPIDFEGRKALIEGVAKTKEKQAVLEGKGWTVVVDAKAGWPDYAEGRTVETCGFYNPAEDRKNFTLLDGTWRLVRLEDQMERPVELRGMARSRNGVWWFVYRGIELYVEDIEHLPGWTHENHWKPMIIRGTLDRAKLPRLDQISLKVSRDLREYFIVRKASWEPLPALLGPERVTEEE